MILSEADADLLKRCLKVTRPSILAFEEFNEQYFNAYGKYYQEDQDVNPITHYEYDEAKREFRLDRMRQWMPKQNSDPETASMTQKERNIYLKNQQAQNAMEKIIKTMKKRDTEGNIQNI